MRLYVIQNIVTGKPMMNKYRPGIPRLFKKRSQAKRRITGHMRREWKPAVVEVNFVEDGK